jgi:hypothetical protein
MYAINNIVSCMVNLDGVWIDIAFIELLRIIATRNYISLTGLHPPNITVTTAYIYFSVFIRRSLVTDFNTVRLRPYRLEQTPIELS